MIQTGDPTGKHPPETWYSYFAWSLEHFDDIDDDDDESQYFRNMAIHIAGTGRGGTSIYGLLYGEQVSGLDHGRL